VPRGRSNTALVDAGFTVVDVETTGLSPAHDRVIEIAAVRLRGGQVVDRFHSLVNPGTGVPPEITNLTGLTAGSLAGQPAFGQIADAILDFAGRDVLVAHNAPFDYGFLREEMRRVGYQFTARTLCTARLGRLLIPGIRRASLDALLSALGLPSRTRHRANGDAALTAEAFVKLLALAEGTGISTLAGLLQMQTARGKLRAAAVTAGIRQLPNAPGVYCFRNGTGQVVYVGKANNLRRRVQSHFRPGAEEPHRLRNVLPTVESVDHIETGSELEALLLESRLIKQYLPSGNQAQRDYHQYPYLRLDTQSSFPRLTVTRSISADQATYYGPFRRARPVGAAVEELVDHFKLPRCQAPIIPGQTPMCIYGQMGRCLAPCSAAVSTEQYRVVIREVQQFLAGDDDGVVTYLEQRRDAAAETLRFEEAAELRDAADELRLVFGAQRQLSAAVHQCHVVVVATSTQPGAVELFAIRGGLLAAQRRYAPAASADEDLTPWLAQVYATAGCTSTTSVRNDQLDEIHIVASWLRREREHHRRVLIDPASPASMAVELATAIAGFDLLTASATR